MKMAMAGGYSDGYGDTTFRYLEIDTLSDALKQRGATVTFAEGAAPDEPADGRKIAEALTVARSADVVVLTVGDSACAHIGSCTCGEAIHSPGR